MKNRLIAVLLAACAALGAMGDTWTDPDTGIEWTYTVSNGETSLGSGYLGGTAVDKSTSGEIVIPSSLGGFSVTSIAVRAFDGCSGLTSVTIPDSVTSIGSEAFWGCSGLTNLTIPASVTSFGADCFEGCPFYTRKLYQTILGAGVGGGSSPASTTIVQQVEAPYVLTNNIADRAIASVTVDSDCAIDEFVLKDGKVYDCLLYINNTAEREVTLTLPAGNTYKAFKGAKPLKIPALSQHIITITRVADTTFLVSREELETLE